ncbi:DNA-binding protein [Bacillus velezensis]|uniref:DNA-binding protein n=1 Tax=Bacillus velezensis TaxID=492670 RepID=UPI001ED9701C|nr:DNA-binding protein [Bacillus velezensis]
MKYKKSFQKKSLNTAIFIGIMVLFIVAIQRIQRGELEPMKEMPRDRLFIKGDVLNF